MVMASTEVYFPLDRDKEESVRVAVVHGGQAINVPDVTQDSRYIPFPEGIPTCSELCVPMKIGGRMIGGLNTESNELNYFSPDIQQLLQALATQTAVALENAWLYAEIRRRARALAAINNASRTIASSLDLPTVLEQVMIEVKAMLKVEGASMLLYTPIARQTFDLVLLDVNLGDMTGRMC